MADLPRWVWDLVADLLDEEDVHPKLCAEIFQQPSGSHEMVRYDWCPSTPLERVPDDVKAAARVLTEYRRSPNMKPESTT
jgi:hypothetical protein